MATEDRKEDTLTADGVVRLGQMLRIREATHSPPRRPLPSPAKRSRRGSPQNSPELRALHVAWRRTSSGMPQAIPHGSQSADRPVQFLRLVREHLPLNPRPPVRSEHERISSSEKPAARPTEISASRSSTSGSNSRLNPRRPIDSISPFSS